MNFAFSDEQEQLREFVRSFLEEKSDEAAVREQMETEQGLTQTYGNKCVTSCTPALIIPEEFGGQGYGYVELIVVLEEMGRHYYVLPTSQAWSLPPTHLSMQEMKRPKLNCSHKLFRNHATLALTERTENGMNPESQCKQADRVKISL